MRASVHTPLAAISRTCMPRSSTSCATSRSGGRSAMALAGPNARTSPRTSTRRSSAMASASVGSCVTTIVVALVERCNSRTICRTVKRFARSKFANGSSSSTSWGERMKTRAIATRRRSPAESAAGRRSARWAIPSDRSKLVTRSRRRSAGSPRGRAALSTFIATERCSCSAASSKLMPTARSHGESGAQSTPPNAMLPLVGRSKPASNESSVLFPAPEGPTSATSRPRGISNETCCKTGTARVPSRRSNETPRTESPGAVASGEPAKAAPDRGISRAPRVGA